MLRRTGLDLELLGTFALGGAYALSELMYRSLLMLFSLVLVAQVVRRRRAEAEPPPPRVRVPTGNSPASGLDESSRFSILGKPAVERGR